MSSQPPTGFNTPGATAPTGVNLPPPALPGAGPQPAVKPKPPGFEPIFLAIVNTFIVGQSPESLDDAKIAAIMRACERLTDKIMADFQRFKGVIPK